MGPVLRSLPEGHFVVSNPPQEPEVREENDLRAVEAPVPAPESATGERTASLSVGSRPLFLLAAHQAPEDHAFVKQAVLGFEQRLGRLGGEGAFQFIAPHQDPAILWSRHAAQGIFFFRGREASVRVHGAHHAMTVVFGADIEHEVPAESAATDIVDFDDVEGGACATRHLISLGYRRIAFLGAHDAAPPHQPFPWSNRRKAGWRRTMLNALQSVEGMEFSLASTREDQHDLRAMHPLPTEVLNAVQTIGTQMAIDAVVAASTQVAREWLRGLDAMNIGPALRPALVCFDSRPNRTEEPISYLHLPWDRLGAEAAQLLWDRKASRLAEAPVRRLVPMQLVPRISHRAERSRSHHVTRGPILLSGRLPAHRLREARRQG